MQKVQLTPYQSINVLRDVDRGEANKQVRNILESQIADKNLIIRQKDSIIVKLERIDQNSQLAINNLKLVSSDWETKFKQADRKRITAVRLGRLALVVGVGAITYGVIKSL